MISTTVVARHPKQPPATPAPAAPVSGARAPAAQAPAKPAAAASAGISQPAPGQPAYTPAPGTAISGFDRQYVPQQGNITFDDLVNAANPLQHVPGVGMIYRAATGTTIPAPLQILGSIAVAAAGGGPAGVAGAIGLNLVTTLVSLGPPVPGHTLKAADYPASSERPMQPTGTGDGVVTYADGSTGLPTWKEGELTNFDMTQAKPANPNDPATRRALAMTAYNTAVKAYGGISGVSA